MTRARASLTLRAAGTHPFVQAPAPAVLSRRAAPDVTRLCGTPVRFIAPDPRLVELSRAGRPRDGHPAPATIAAARVGDPVFLRPLRDSWRTVTRAGQRPCRMSRAFQPPRNHALLRAETAAILISRSGDGDAACRTRHHRPNWEVVLPERSLATLRRAGTRKNPLGPRRG